MSMLQSINPSNGSIEFEVDIDNDYIVQFLLMRAREAQPKWASLPLSDRIDICVKFADLLLESKEILATTISKEMGKPLWESYSEVNASYGKIQHSINALSRTSRTESEISKGVLSVVDYKPLGVVAVLGPFNFPLHLPNGHIVPALLMGNAIIFKPSEFTPKIGASIKELWAKAGLPDGIFNIIHGKKETGVSLCSSKVDGIFFTGSSKVGNEINKQLALDSKAGTMLALEMGGNNPLVVWDVDEKDTKSAIMNVIESAFITSGQRCVCARRLILENSKADDFIKELVATAKKIKVSDPFSNPYMGPLVSVEAADKVLMQYKHLCDMGAEEILPMRRSKHVNAIVYPGIVDSSELARVDCEIFGPLLQIIRVETFEDAIVEANSTSYGLAAGLISNSKGRWDHFFKEINAGIVNWNKPTTGALGSNPFGGVGNSGNHRPGAFFASDYCSYPIASVQSDEIKAPTNIVFK
jgi:succinylglutamic semialdehyde dehydrogenase